MNILLNGIGRIGKAILRIANSSDEINIVAINELNANINNLIYSINYDSTYGPMDDKFLKSGSHIKNKATKIRILNHSSPMDIDYSKYNIDIIIDASGSKIDTKQLKTLPIKAIFLTHPNKNADINIILGVNEKELNKNQHKVISTSSCNATALLPVLKLIDDNYNILYGDITTVHPLLNHQKVLDSSCIGSSNREVQCNFEFGRSATQNIIPSKTTTIDACSFILPNINSSIISSSSLRVPTDTVGVINTTFLIDKKCSKKKLIALFKKYEKNQKSKIILNNNQPLVSTDFKGETYTTIIDHRFTDVKGKKMIKLVLWYDNEWGYASKVVDIVKNFIKLW